MMCSLAACFVVLAVPVQGQPVVRVLLDKRVPRVADDHDSIRWSLVALDLDRGRAVLATQVERGNVTTLRQLRLRDGVEVERLDARDFQIGATAHDAMVLARWARSSQWWDGDGDVIALSSPAGQVVMASRSWSVPTGALPREIPIVRGDVGALVDPGRARWASECALDERHTRGVCVVSDGHRQAFAVHAAPFAWAPDGSLVVFHNDDLRCLARIDVASGAITPLGCVPGLIDNGPIVSPDGARAYMIAMSDGRYELVAIDLLNGAIVHQFPLPTSYTLRVALDGERLLAQASGNSYVIDAAHGTSRLLDRHVVGGMLTSLHRAVDSGHEVVAALRWPTWQRMQLVLIDPASL